MGAGPYILEMRTKIGHDLLLLPGVTVIVVREAAAGRELLLARRSDDGTWTPITGMVDPGEDTDVAAIRECREETGVDVVVDRVTWIETLAVSTYPNGDQCQYYDVCVLAHPVSGDAHVADDESLDVRWFPEDALPEMDARFQRKVRHALSGDTRVLFGAEGR